MSKLFFAIGIIGVISCGASSIFKALELDFTGAMAWLFGVFINGVMVALNYEEIKDGL